MGQSIAKLSIMLGVDTSGIISGIDGSAIPKIREFKQRADEISHSGLRSFAPHIDLGGHHSFAEGLAHSFHQAHVSLSAMEGSMTSIGKLAMNLSLAGVGIAAAFKAAEFAIEGIGLAMGQDKEAMDRWKTFKDELAELSLLIGEFLLPIINAWLEAGIALARALKGTVAPKGTAERLENPEGWAKERREAAAKALEIEKKISEEMEKQERLIADAIRKKNEAFVEMGKRISEEVKTPAEILKQKVGELNFLANRGLITFETFSRAINKAASDFADMGKKAERFHLATSTENAAVDRFTMAGYSATFEATNQWNQIKEFERLQLEEEKLANDKRDQIIRILKEGGTKVKEVTF